MASSGESSHCFLDGNNTQQLSRHTPTRARQERAGRSQHGFRFFFQRGNVCETGGIGSAVELDVDSGGSYNSRLYQHMCDWRSTAAVDLDSGSSYTTGKVGSPPLSPLPFWLLPASHNVWTLRNITP